MLYLLCLVLPPLACLMAGRFWHAVLNLTLCLTVVLIPAAVIHAWFVVRASYEGERGVNVHIHNYDRGRP